MSSLGLKPPSHIKGLELQFCRDFCPESLLPLSVMETSMLLVVQLWCCFTNSTRACSWLSVNVAQTLALLAAEWHSDSSSHLSSSLQASSVTSKPSSVSSILSSVPSVPTSVLSSVLSSKSPPLEAKASKKTVLRVRCLRSVSFIGSKGALGSSLSTTERSDLEGSWNFWDDPCENWRVSS